MSRKLVRASSQNMTFTGGAGSVGGYPFTIACWFQTTNPQIGSNQVLFTISDNSTNNNTIAIGPQNTDGKIGASVSNAAGAFFNPADPGAILTANTWYPTLFVGASSTNRTLYISNSATSANDTASCPLAAVTTITVGAFWSGNFLDGLMDDAAYWNIALTTAEVDAYCKGALPYTIRPLSLMGYWPLNGLASPEPDLSGNRRNLTLNNAPTLGPIGAPVMQFTPRRLPPPMPPLFYTIRKQVRLNILQTGP